MGLARISILLFLSVVLPVYGQDHHGSIYVGDAVCQSCHQELTSSFHRTTHYITSQVPSAKSILGSFSQGANTLRTSNPQLVFKLEARSNGWFETAMEGTPPLAGRSEKIALVVGSGEKGQTYIFRDENDDLFQLPISYWKQAGWVNSPGYRDGVANFSRPVVPRCLECHTTYFDSLSPPENHYARTGFIVGITCEKCHGAGSDHVKLQHANKAKTVGAGGEKIANPAKLPRDRQVELCAWCHAGAGEPVAKSSSYEAGEVLAQHVQLTLTSPESKVDVHGNQVGLLMRSRCFQSSGMTCSTCHNVHAVQHDDAEFSQHCLGCHKVESCGLFSSNGHTLEGHCVDCHMPAQKTSLIVFDQGRDQVAPRMRNHWIKVYSKQALADDAVPAP